MIQDVVSMIFTLIAAVCVIILTYYVSKWYARKMGAAGGGKHIKLIDRLVVSKTGSILVIDVAGTQYLVGASENNIQIIKELDEPISFTEETEKVITKDYFIDVLKSIKNKRNDDGE